MSVRRKRRWPPLVRREGSSLRSAHRRTVAGCMPSISAASRRLNHSSSCDTDIEPIPFPLRRVPANVSKNGEFAGVDLTDSMRLARERQGEAPLLSKHAQDLLLLSFGAGGLPELCEGFVAHALLQFVQESVQGLGAGVVLCVARVQRGEQEGQTLLVALLFAEEQADIRENHALALPVLVLLDHLEGLQKIAQALGEVPLLLC